MGGIDLAAIDHAGGLLADADDLYFSTLKLHWPALLLHVFAAYAAIVFVAMLINLICANGLEFDGTGTWWTAVMYAAVARCVEINCNALHALRLLDGVGLTGSFPHRRTS